MQEIQASIPRRIVANSQSKTGFAIATDNLYNNLRESGIGNRESGIGNRELEWTKRRAEISSLVANPHSNYQSCYYLLPITNPAITYSPFPIPNSPFPIPNSPLRECTSRNLRKAIDVTRSTQY
ncbi:MAG: hypothetical protein WBA89_23930 [Microcoleus sp.]|uniref:hypothetical protein n=1 Tax=Microcoleus sp. TaxID=44472 RepID=UPI003C74FC7A